MSVFHSGIIATITVLITAFSTGSAFVWAQSHQVDSRAGESSYMMYRYEKSNIDMIILDHAKASQTIMFGEIHNSALEGAPAPIEDSVYVTDLIVPLKKIGYDYLALEVNRQAPEGSHSHDIVRFYTDWRNGDAILKENYPDAQPGWIDLVGAALTAGYRIRFIDVPPRKAMVSDARDKAMFEMIKKEIFDAAPEARVIVYVGAYHIEEAETTKGIFLGKGRQKRLGFYLDQYTSGKNFSVYMGHPDDTPEGCDLFISNFIWHAKP